jgi:hypothetical protein
VCLAHEGKWTAWCPISDRAWRWAQPHLIPLDTLANWEPDMRPVTSPTKVVGFPHPSVGTYVNTAHILVRQGWREIATQPTRVIDVSRLADAQIKAQEALCYASQEDSHAAAH